MKRKIVLLTDYKGFFGSKQMSKIYRGGMDLGLLSDLFKKRGYDTEIIPFYKLDVRDILSKNAIVLYTSSEDNNALYKSFIEDIIYNLEESGSVTLPKFAYLKAHDNKVAMELLRSRSELDMIKTIESKVYGTLEELTADLNEIKLPVVVKSYSGAMSKGVGLAKTRNELIKLAKKISASGAIFHDTKDSLRKVKYKSEYKKESINRRKFVVQNLIDGLSNDWKILVYGNKCFALNRRNRENDFRASGSGLFSFKKEIPEGILDFALKIRSYFNVPHISLDIAFDGEKFHLIEFQFLYFGTTTLEKAPFYFIKDGLSWICKTEKQVLEEVYVESIVEHLEAGSL